MLKHISCRAAALIINGGKILAAKNVNHPSFYLVGGGIEAGESSEEAIVREIFEETGKQLEIDRLAVIQERFYTADNQPCQEIVFFYLIKNPADIDIPNNSHTDQGANETLHWLPIDALKHCNIVPQFIKTFSFDDIKGVQHIVSHEE